MNDLIPLFNNQILANSQFVSATFTGRDRAGFEDEWKKIIVKPVLLKNILMYQFNYYDNLKSITKNYSSDESSKELARLLTLKFKNIYIRNETSGTQIQITKKGKLLVKSQNNLEQIKADLVHDRKKSRIIQNEPQNSYLKVLGFVDDSEQLKPSMQGKFKQINEFVKLLENLQDWTVWNKNINIVDCGAGNAYLTFATFHYFSNILKKTTHMTGIDVDPTSIENNIKRVNELGWQNIDFEISNIIGFSIDLPPTITMALHACDTATDEALMKGVNWNSEFILSVPCCHHNLQERLKRMDINPDFNGVVKHGILRERLGDILTDSFRSLILEIMGYKTEVIQFVATEHTAKNLMIRAKKVSNQPLENSVQNYLLLKSYWKVTPILENLLKNTSDLANRLSSI